MGDEIRELPFCFRPRPPSLSSPSSSPRSSSSCSSPSSVPGAPRPETTPASPAAEAPTPLTNVRRRRPAAVVSG
ncbi:hypothetical protein ACFQL4_22255 [Halosimplex aquaticum]